MVNRKPQLLYCCGIFDLGDKKKLVEINHNKNIAHFYSKKEGRRSRSRSFHGYHFHIYTNKKSAIDFFSISNCGKCDQFTAVFLSVPR